MNLRIDNEVLYLDIETENLHAVWAPFRNRYGIFFLIHVSGAFIITPENEEELFFKVRTKNEEVNVQTIELFKEDEKLILQLRELLKEYNVNEYKELVDV